MSDNVIFSAQGSGDENKVGVMKMKLPSSTV